MSAYDLIVVGASWGGLEAVGALLGALPASFGVPIAVAQHRSSSSSEEGLERALGHVSALPVSGVDDKDPIRSPGVYIAPPDYHLLVERGHFALSVDERVQYARPSLDVLFESAADAYAPRLIGVVLTGGNADGAAGLSRIRRKGGFTLVQDPETADRRAMPDAAIATGAAQRVLAPAVIPSVLLELCRDEPVAGSGGSA